MSDSFYQTQENQFETKEWKRDEKVPLQYATNIHVLYFAYESSFLIKEKKKMEKELFMHAHTNDRELFVVVIISWAVLCERWFLCNSYDGT